MAKNKEKVEDKEVSRLLEKAEIKRIPLDRLDPSGYNPNVQDENEYSCMKQDLKENGQAYPLIVAPGRKGFYVILDGNHRLRAMQELGWTDAQCRIIDVPLELRKMVSVRLNKNRGKLDPFKLAAIFAEEQKNGLTQKQIGEKYGYKQPTVANILASAGLRGMVDPAIAAQAPKHLLAQVARIEDKEKQEEIISSVLSDPDKIPSERNGARLIALSQVAEKYKPIVESVPDDRQVEFAQWIHEVKPKKSLAKKLARLTNESPSSTLQELIELLNRPVEAEIEEESWEESAPEEVSVEPSQPPKVETKIMPPVETTCPHCGAHIKWDTIIGGWDVVSEGKTLKED